MLLSLHSSRSPGGPPSSTPQRLSSASAGSPRPERRDAQDDTGFCRRAALFACSGNHTVIKRPFLRGCVIACLSTYYAVRLFVSAVMRLSARPSQLSSRPYVWLPVCPDCSLYYLSLTLLSCERAISKFLFFFFFFYCLAAQNPHLQRADRVWRSIRMTKQLFLQLLRFLAAVYIRGSTLCLDTRLLNTTLTWEEPICSRKSWIKCVNTE